MSYAQVLTAVFLMIIATGLLGLRRQWKTVSWRVAAAGLLGMFMLSWPPAVALIAQPLTRWYPRQPLPIGDAEAIVVLAGSVSYPTAQRPYMFLGRDTYRRVLHSAWLYRAWKPLPILASGGPEGRGEPAAISMRRVLEQEGVPSSRIWTEEASRSTYENALYSTKLLHQHGIHVIALVTEADSMLRAEKCFRKQGISVTPAPCVFRDAQFVGQDLLPGWTTIYRAEVLAHEIMGLVWYWMHGWI